MSPEYQQVLKEADQVKREFKNRANALRSLRGIVNDLYACCCYSHSCLL